MNETGIADISINAENRPQAEQKLLLLLAARIRVYTHGECSSVRLETAQELMSSIRNVLRMYCLHSSISSTELMNGNIDTAFHLGLLLIEQKYHQTRRLWQRLRRELLTLDNEYLLRTAHGIEESLAHYDLCDMTHLLCGEIDYQLSCPIDEQEQGISYLHLYLLRLQTENRLLNAFPRRSVYTLLDHCRPDHRSLPLNLYEPVALAALALFLLRRPPFALHLDQHDLIRLQQLLDPLDEDQRSALLHKTAEETCCHLRLNSRADLLCLHELINNNLPRLTTALRERHIENIFPGWPR